MVDGYFLSEVIDLDQLKPGRLNLVTSPCGSGKTYCALHKFPELVDRMENIIYLTDTIALRQQLSLKKECRVYNPTDNEILKGNVINFEEINNQIILMTYAKMGLLLKHNPHMFDGIGLIICDELHQVSNFIAWERNKIKKEHPHASPQEISTIMTFDSGAFLAAQYIDMFAMGLELDGTPSKKPKIVIGMSATPAKAYALFYQSYEQIKIDAQLRAYETLHTYYYTDLAALLTSLDKTKKTLLYIPRITQMQKAIDLVCSLGVRAEGIWSENNKEHKMSEKQIWLKNYIIETETIPDEYDFVFYNAAYETGINIKDKIECVVVHSMDEDNQIQSHNRVRGDLHTVYLLANKEQKICVKIPAQYLETPLGKKEKEELCQYYNIRNSQGKLMGWTSVKKMLIEAGYKIKTTRPTVDGKRVSRDVISYGNEV